MKLKYRIKITQHRIERFIKKLYLNTLIQVKQFIKDHLSWSIINKSIIFGLNITISGMLTFYSITHFNWLSIGILLAIITYYIEWFVTLIKSKTE